MFSQERKFSLRNAIDIPKSEIENILKILKAKRSLNRKIVKIRKNKKDLLSENKLRVLYEIETCLTTKSRITYKQLKVVARILNHIDDYDPIFLGKVLYEMYSTQEENSVLKNKIGRVAHQQFVKYSSGIFESALLVLSASYLYQENSESSLLMSLLCFSYDQVIKNTLLKDNEDTQSITSNIWNVMESTMTYASSYCHFFKKQNLSISDSASNALVLTNQTHRYGNN